MDHIIYATRALFWTLRSSLPARLTTADASRKAQIISAPGPYVIPSAGTLEINGTSAALTSGTRTAAQVAGEVVGISGVTAAADAEGGLVISGSVPTASSPSVLRVGGGTANDVLGLVANSSDVVRLALSDSGPRFIEGVRAPIFHEQNPPGLDGISVVIATKQRTETHPKPLRQRLADIAITLDVSIPGPLGGAPERRAVEEAVAALVAEIRGCVEDGDSRGRYMVGGATYGAQIVKCLPVRAAPAIEHLSRPGSTVCIGRAYPEFTVQVFDPIVP